MSQDTGYLRRADVANPGLTDARARGWPMRGRRSPGTSQEAVA